MTPTIYEALKTKLGREPTHHELCLEARRIITDSHQRVRGRPTQDEQRESYRTAMIDAGRGRLLS